MLTGFLILVIASLTMCVWQQFFLSLRMRSKLGHLLKSRPASVTYRSWRSQPDFVSLDVSEHHWISDTVAAQRFIRTGMDTVYVGSVAGTSSTFYTLHDMSRWFVEAGVDLDDPVWDYLETLAQEEITNN